MAYSADKLREIEANVNGRWVAARPINYRYEPFLWRLRDAWLVLTRKADAVTFTEGAPDVIAQTPPHPGAAR